MSARYAISPPHCLERVRRLRDQRHRSAADCASAARAESETATFPSAPLHVLGRGAAESRTWLAAQPMRPAPARGLVAHGTARLAGADSRTCAACPHAASRLSGLDRSHSQRDTPRRRARASRLRTVLRSWATSLRELAERHLADVVKGEQIARFVIEVVQRPAQDRQPAPRFGLLGGSAATSGCSSASHPSTSSWCPARRR